MEGGGSGEGTQALLDELARMRVMVMQYAQIVLNYRLHAPTVTDAERQHIPSNIVALRKAIAATPSAKFPCTSAFVPSVDAEPRTNARQANGNLHALPSSTVQSELARLRMKVEQLTEQSASQTEELAAARRALVAAGVSQARAGTGEVGIGWVCTKGGRGREGG